MMLIIKLKARSSRPSRALRLLRITSVLWVCLDRSGRLTATGYFGGCFCPVWLWCSFCCSPPVWSIYEVFLQTVRFIRIIRIPKYRFHEPKFIPYEHLFLSYELGSFPLPIPPIQPNFQNTGSCARTFALLLPPPSSPAKRKARLSPRETGPLSGIPLTLTAGNPWGNSRCRF